MEELHARFSSAVGSGEASGTGAGDGGGESGDGKAAVLTYMTWCCSKKHGWEMFPFLDDMPQSWPPAAVSVLCFPATRGRLWSGALMAATKTSHSPGQLPDVAVAAAAAVSMAKCRSWCVTSRV